VTRVFSITGGLDMPFAKNAQGYSTTDVLFYEMQDWL
jgi:hypothetical protein